MDFIHTCVILTICLRCNGLKYWNQINGDGDAGVVQRRSRPTIYRRFGSAGEPSVILGAPSYPYHLPPAEPILPGHTLIRPAIGMLKSSVKFPHREQEDGSGVYGHIDNLGIKFGGGNERVLYTGFRRSLPGNMHKVKLQNNKSPYRRRHLESYSPKKKEKLTWHKDKFSDIDRVNKVITIYPAVPITSIKLKGQTQRPKKKHLRYLEQTPIYLIKPQKHYNEIPRYQYEYKPQLSHKQNKKPRLAKVVAMQKIDGTVLQDLFRLIKSLRRDQEETHQDLKTERPRPKQYVPGKVGYGQFATSQIDSDEGEIINKTAQFWKTKDAFNHIVISQDAPDHSELLPPEATEKKRNWWFYHQLDFQEFADK